MSERPGMPTPPPMRTEWKPAPPGVVLLVVLAPVVCALALALVAWGTARG